MSALAALADRLRGFRAGIAASPEWMGEPALGDVLGTLRVRHKRQARAVDRARIMELVSRYLRTGQVAQPADLVGLGLGAGWLDADGQGILADRLLRRRLFDLAETAPGRPRRLRAFRSLLYAYWSFPLHDPATADEARAGWAELRDWLRRRHGEIARHPARKPTWFRVLAQHLHLLDENPCARYAAALLGGDFSELQQAIDCLFIPAGSWIKTEAVMAQIAAATALDDAAFRARLPALLRVAVGEAGIRVGDAVTRRAVAALLMRYARLEAGDADEDLFLLALERIGNPWREQAAWDADVRAGGEPCVLARAMLGAWLKDRIIGAFFADRGRADARSDYWQRYAVFMTGLALAGPAADGTAAALLLRITDFLVVVPQARDALIAAYPWPTVCKRGGARLLDRDEVDAAALGAAVARCEPVMRLGQDDPARCDAVLRRVLFTAAS